MTITVRFFSQLRRLAGTETAELSLTEGATVAMALRAVLDRFPALRDTEASTLAAINEEWTPRDRILREGDELALMPPVSGG
jgi:molybdopterin converting factor subunit 1